MGRLGANVRDRLGLAYYVSSVLQVGPGPHPWNVVAGVNPSDVDSAIEAILHEVGCMRDELVSEEELEDSKTYLNGALPLHLETNEGISGLLLDIEQYGLGYDYLQRYPDIIGAVTREDVQRMVRHYLDPQRAVLAMAGTFARAAP
jgi:zinc protease